MTSASNWPAALVTIAMLLTYEIAVLLVQRRSPARLARGMVDRYFKTARH